MKQLADERHFTEKIDETWSKIIGGLMSDLHFQRIPRRSNILRGVVERVVPSEQQPCDGAKWDFCQFEGGILDADSHGKGIAGPIE